MSILWRVELFSMQLGDKSNIANSDKSNTKPSTDNHYEYSSY